MSEPSSAEPKFQLRYLGPRFWPLWLGVGLVRLLCALLPVPWLAAMGRPVGRLFGRIAKKRRHVVDVNLKLCFPEMHEAERARMVDAHFAALGAGLFETAAAWFAPDRHFRNIGELVGLEHFHAATADGSGALLLTGHFSAMEIGARYLCLAGIRFHAMYRPLDNPLLDYWMHRWREDRSGLPALPKDDLRGIVRALRRGGSLWYGPDQTLEAPGAIYVPFFGVPALTLTATSKLAQMGRARVVPFFPAYVDGRYRITMLPALENFPSGDDTADARRINALLEEAIRQCPEQYFWVHKRFKYQPGDRRDVYD
jgi:KDO2-lipid IV(A) lauroyltransferase